MSLLDGIKNAKDVAITFQDAVSAAIDLVHEIEPIVSAVCESANLAKTVFKQLRGYGILGESQSLEMVDARRACHLVTVECDSVVKSLQGLCSELTMDNAVGNRSQEDKKKRFDQLLQEVGDGDQEAFKAYKRGLNVWYDRLTDDIKLLEANKTLNTAKANVKQLHESASTHVLMALGETGLGTACLVYAAVAGFPMASCISLVSLIVFSSELVAKLRIKLAASDTYEALSRVEELLMTIGGTAKMFCVTFVETFGEGDDPQEQVEAMESLCAAGGLAEKLVKLLHGLDRTLQEVDKGLA